MRVGKVCGIQVSLNNWFLLLMTLFAFAGLTAKALAVFSSVFLHELAHALVALSLGYTVREIELLPFGGVARIERLGEAGSSSEILIAAAGPTTSLVLAALMYIGMKHCVAWAEEFTFLCQINLMLAVFNLIPGLPLDGGRIFRAWLTQYRDYSQATVIAASCSKIIALLLLISAVYTYIQFATINLTFVIAAIFLYVSAKTEVKVAGFRQMKVLAQKKAELTTKGIMPTKHFTAVSGIRARDVINQFGPEYYYIVIIVDNNFRLRGTLTETEVWEGLPSHGIYATMDKFLS